MKLSLPIFSAVLLLAGLTACKDDDDSPQNPSYGAQYFECKVNGVDFVPQGTPFACDALTFNYYPEAFLDAPAGYMVFGGVKCSEDQNISIRIYGMHSHTGLLDFLDPSFADSISPYFGYLDPDNGEFIVIDQLVSGSMMIDEFSPRQPGANTPSGNFQGTFNFTLTDTSGVDTLHITDGRFRFNVAQVF